MARSQGLSLWPGPSARGCLAPTIKPGPRAPAAAASPTPSMRSLVVLLAALALCQGSWITRWVSASHGDALGGSLAGLPAISPQGQRGVSGGNGQVPRRVPRRPHWCRLRPFPLRGPRPVGVVRDPRTGLLHQTTASVPASARTELCAQCPRLCQSKRRGSPSPGLREEQRTRYCKGLRPVAGTQRCARICCTKPGSLRS